MLDKLAALAKLISELTLPRVALALLLLGGGVTLWALWDLRASLYPSLLESQAAMISIGAFIALVILGLVWESLQRRIDERTDAVQAHLQEELRSEREERRNLYQLVLKLTAEQASIQARERECLARVKELTRRFDISGFGSGNSGFGSHG